MAEHHAGKTQELNPETMQAYQQFIEDPSHPSLRFKKVHLELPMYSAPISRDYQSVGQRDTVIWFWVVLTPRTT
jgi:hypothetical protein